jgi:hypothetical protein
VEHSDFLSLDDFNGESQDLDEVLSEAFPGKRKLGTQQMFVVLSIRS